MTTTSDPALSTDPALPGRLGDPDAAYATDPRAHRALRDQLTALGLAGVAAGPPFGREAGRDDVIAFVAAAEGGFEAVYAAVPADQPTGEGVTRTVMSVPGRDGNAIPLYVFRPTDIEATTALPGLVYIHGGGMSILLGDNGIHTRWCEDLARTGLVVAAPDFRNAGGELGPHPFPAGLHDCADVVDWLAAHRDEVGMSSLTLQGESGGANLCLATTLAAKRAGTIDTIAGVYAMVPYISGGYGWSHERQRAELPSLVENNGWFLDTGMMDLLVAAYDPDDTERENPLAWPYFAAEDDLRGLPPHVIAVNELDPLRDEGIAYYRKLQAAGVPSTGRVNLGLTHGADSIFKTAIGDFYDSTVSDISRFARHAG